MEDFLLYTIFYILDSGGEARLRYLPLATLTIMIAESKLDEMEMMITVIMNCMK